jgi:cell division protein FtsQ
VKQNKYSKAKSKKKITASWSSFRLTLLLLLLLLLIVTLYKVTLHFLDSLLLSIHHVQIYPHRPDQFPLPTPRGLPVPSSNLQPSLDSAGKQNLDTFSLSDKPQLDKQSSLNCFKRIHLDSLKKSIQPKIKGFFSTNMLVLKQEILRKPFVDEVMIKRLWPDTLLIELTESCIVAKWGEGGCISSQGKIIPIKLNNDHNLPLFQGPNEQAGKILEFYNTLSALLPPHHLAVSKLELNRRHSWQVTLDNGIKILLGRKDAMEHMKLFLAIYQKLKKQHANDIDYIDLRYPNGISLYLSPHSPDSLRD